MQAQLALICSGLAVAYMSLWYAWSLKRGQLNVVDAAWPGGFVLLAWFAAVWQPSARSYLIAILVTLWGARLFSHLVGRVLSGGEDPRYKELSKNWKRNYWLRAYFSVFFLQALLVVLIGLPIIMATGEQNVDLGVFSIFGAIVWVIGFMIESAADYQLKIFVKNRRTQNEVMDQGLWRYSRHPNYFGEITQWWGIGLIALQASYGWVGLAGPLTLTLLILFVSGIPPIEKRRKQSKSYREYMSRTSMLLPLPPKSSQRST